MRVTECEIPSVSGLGRALIERADFRDAHRAPLRSKELGVVEIFLAIFAHRTWWMKALLLLRNQAAARAGLEVPSMAEILHPETSVGHAVGDKIIGWPIFALTDTELIAGRDNAHLDFRVSVLKLAEGETISVVVSTICIVRNRFGERYLRAVGPFHKRGVPMLITKAMAAGRM